MFIQARHYTPVTRRRIDLLVIHDMEAPEKPLTAENVARWFAGPSAPQASAHYCIDNNSVVQCVYDHDVAWHAPGANHDGIGLEHAGYAAQTGAQWLDKYGLQMMEISAELAAKKCRRYAIPIRLVDAKGLRAGQRGITRHVDVSAAFGGTHHDPGPNFPMSYYLGRVRAHTTRLQRAAIEVRHVARVRRTAR